MTRLWNRLSVGPLALAAGVFLGACTRSIRAGDVVYLPRSVLDTTLALTAAADEAHEIIPRLTRPLGRAGRLGFRGGYLVVAETDIGRWEPSFLAGIYYRGGRFPVHEVGLDLATVAGEYVSGETATSEIYFVRFALLFGRWEGSAGTTVYFLSGAEVGLENATWDATGYVLHRQALAVSVGLGLGSSSGLWDARVAYSFFAGSDGSTGSLLAALGFSF